MKKQTLYHITFLDRINGKIVHKYFKRVKNARKSIRKDFDICLSCWKEISTNKKSITVRIFRNINNNEPKEWFNNKIKA
jgi:hypothetical protein